MFGLSGRSARKMADMLYAAGMGLGGDIARKNFLQLSVDTLPHMRFVISAYIFGNLMCQELLKFADKDRVRVLECSRLLTERHLCEISGKMVTSVRVSDFVVWPTELDSIKGSVSEAGASLPDLIRELYLVRRIQMTADMMEGAAEAIDQGGVGLLLPTCRTFILQATGDAAFASNARAVAAFSASIELNWTLLQQRVREVAA
jgi:hypothetical protein